VSENIPQYAKSIIVPVANPATATSMLDLAVSLIDPEEGRLIALIVNTGKHEETSERLAVLQPICDDYIERGHQVELVTQIAGSVTRGILDSTREFGAELLILGVQQSERRQVKLGSVVENIIQAAPCDVLIYRPATNQDYKRVVVTLDGSLESLTALRTGVIIAKNQEAHLCPMYIQRDYVYQGERESQIRTALDALSPEKVHKEIVHGRDPAERVLHELHMDDLLILGFSQNADLDLQMGKDLASVLLNRASSPVVLSSRLHVRDRDSLLGAVQYRLERWNPSLTPVERNELLWEAQKSALPNIDFSMLIILSAALASLGLLLNSSAVIIGAMLVAPLMSPLAALSTGLITGQLGIIQRAAMTLLQGVLLALLIAVLAGWLLPIESPTAEMLARGNPSLLDAGVALVSGFVAAFATARKEIPVALAGVAIAAALMPPVCTIGLGLALGDLRLAGGAALLFTTNIVFIVVAQYVIFLWLGMRPGRRQETLRGVYTWWILIVGLLIVVLSLIFQLSRSALDEAEIESFLINQLPASEFINLDTGVSDNDVLQVVFTVRNEEPITPPQVEAAQSGLAQRLNRPVDLEIVTMQVVRPRSHLEQQIVDVLQSTLSAQQLVEIVQIEMQQGASALFITATIRIQSTISSAHVAMIETELRDSLQQAVQLRIIPQQIIGRAAGANSEANSVPE